MREPRFNPQKTLHTLRQIDAVARRRGQAWVPWILVARQLGGAMELADQLSAAFELEPLRPYVRQNATGRMVTLTDVGRQSVRDDVLVGWSPAPPPREVCWLYYSRYRQPPGEFRLMMHHASCADCDHGRGRTGAPFAQISPSTDHAALPAAAWIGPFDDEASAVEWCREHPRLGCPPKRCANCYRVT